jgi:hypothetical protein
VSQQPTEHEEVLDPNFRFVIVSDNVPNHCVQAKKPPSKQTVTADTISLLSTQGFAVMKWSTTPLIRTLVIRIANSRLGPSGKCVENSTKQTCLEIAGYRIKYSTVLWLLELQIRRG